MSLDSFLGLLRKHLSEKDLERMTAFMAGMAPERRSALMQFLAEREVLAPAVGAEAPDFELPWPVANDRPRNISSAANP